MFYFLGLVTAEKVFAVKNVALTRVIMVDARVRRGGGFGIRNACRDRAGERGNGAGGFADFQLSVVVLGRRWF